MISGDPLPRPAEDEEVYSASRLSMIKALYIDQDYLSYGPDAAPEELLGTIVLLRGVSCKEATPDKLAAFKKRGAGWLAFRTPGTGVVRTCSPKVSSAQADVSFKVTHRVEKDGTLTPLSEQKPRTIAISEVRELIRRMPNTTKEVE